MIWKEEENEDFGTLNILEGHRTLATVRQDDTVKATIVTVSIVLPPDRLDDGKWAAEMLMSKAIEAERRFGL